MRGCSIVLCIFFAVGTWAQTPLGMNNHERELYSNPEFTVYGRRLSAVLENLFPALSERKIRRHADARISSIESKNEQPSFQEILETFDDTANEEFSTGIPTTKHQYRKRTRKGRFPGKRRRTRMPRVKVIRTKADQDTTESLINVRRGNVRKVFKSRRLADSHQTDANSLNVQNLANTLESLTIPEISQETHEQGISLKAGGVIIGTRATSISNITQDKELKTMENTKKAEKSIEKKENKIKVLPTAEDNIKVKSNFHTTPPPSRPRKPFEKLVGEQFKRVINTAHKLNIRTGFERISPEDKSVRELIFVNPKGSPFEGSLAYIKTKNGNTLPGNAVNFYIMKGPYKDTYHRQLINDSKGVGAILGKSAKTIAIPSMNSVLSKIMLNTDWEIMRLR